ncbi:MAG: TolC family protein [Vicinamibacteraceae bacterium]
MSRLPAVLALGGALVAGAGCASRAPFDPAAPATALRQRTGVGARLDGVVVAAPPPGIRLDDGLTADEAVALALWNNAAFQVSVADLGFARADLVEAGVLTNPVLSLLLPVGPKQLEATLRFPMEVLWERPRRVRAAHLALDAAAQRLVQAGLDLVLNVRLAYADASLAVDREQLARDAAGTFARIAILTQSRLAEGDISALEARSATIDAARAVHDRQRAAHDVVLARQRLALLLGQSADAFIAALASSSEAATCAATAELVREAAAARPDVRAAEIGVEAAAARLGWERSRILALTAVLDANGQGREGFEMGPGVDIGLPVLNRNQGPRTRARVQLERASAAYAALQQQVGFEVREARTLFDQAQESLTSWTDTVLVPLQANVADADQSFRDGETSYLFVLDNARRLTEARIRERDLRADRQRAQARIERAVGRSCSAPPQEVPRGR